MAYKPGGDLCLGFWADAWNAGVVSFPQGAHVLEIGCAEANWITPMMQERPDLQIYGLDWRRCEREQAADVRQADVLTTDYQEACFDAVVSVSAIEHIGLGSYENDPTHEDGDRIAMERAFRWLKPGGWMYLDVPYRQPGGYHVTSNYRGYDEDAVQARLIVGGFEEAWRKIVGEGKGDGPYLSLVLRKPV